MRDAFDSFLYRHWPRSFLLAALALLAAYGLWWLAADVSVRTYPQRVANTIPVPPNVKLIDTETFYSRKCELSQVILYYATNESWNNITVYYTEQLKRGWMNTGELEFYQQSGKYSELHWILYHLDLTPEGKPSDPSKKQIVFNGSTAYLIQIAYNQDLRVFGKGGACEPTD